MCVLLSLFSCVQLFATPWTVAQQAPLSMEFSWQEYWSGICALLQGICLIQGSNPHFLRLLHCSWIFFITELLGKPSYIYYYA